MFNIVNKYNPNIHKQQKRKIWKFNAWLASLILHCWPFVQTALLNTIICCTYTKRLPSFVCVFVYVYAPSCSSGPWTIIVWMIHLSNLQVLRGQVFYCVLMAAILTFLTPPGSHLCLWRMGQAVLTYHVSLLLFMLRQLQCIFVISSISVEWGKKWGRARHVFHRQIVCKLPQCFKQKRATNCLWGPLGVVSELL